MRLSSDGIALNQNEHYAKTERQLRLNGMAIALKWNDDCVEMEQQLH